MRTMKRLSSLLLLAAIVLIPAGLSAQDSSAAKPKIRRNPDLISQEEIQNMAADARNAYEIVSKLRPIWLSTRGVGSMSGGTVEVQVYVNDVHQGGPGALSQVPREGVLEIRHLRGIDATQRFGTNHENGAILVKLK